MLSSMSERVHTFKGYGAHSNQPRHCRYLSAKIATTAVTCIGATRNGFAKLMASSSKGDGMSTTRLIDRCRLC